MSNVLPLPDLLASVQAWRSAGQVIVTTNGCFDLLHVGHLRYLQATKAEGDRLIVLVNSDLSVRGLGKASNRPIVPEAERAELIAGLACVDAACIFSGHTPIPELEQIKPDVHAKGGQYTEATLPEAPILKGLGTRLAFISMVEGRSTTSLIQKIVDA